MKRMSSAEFSCRTFAAEPEIVKPIAFASTPAAGPGGRVGDTLTDLADGEATTISRSAKTLMAMAAPTDYGVRRGLNIPPA
jgi:hypothetical protein